MVFKTQIGEKVGRRQSNLHQMCQKFRFSSVSNNLVPFLDLFRNFTSIRKTMGSKLKRLATGSVSKRYETNLFAQLSKSLLENVHFDLFVKYLIFIKLQAKTLDMENTFQRKLFQAFSWVRMVEALNNN